MRMRRLHRTVRIAAEDDLEALDHIYAWNDSVLSVSVLRDGSRDAYEMALRDVSALKATVEGIASAYAIAVKGQAFPRRNGRGTDDGRVTVLHASSWAMANCLRIESELGRLRGDWYIDSRISDKIPSLADGRAHMVEMLPTHRKRRVLVFSSDPFGDQVRGVGATRSVLRS